MIVLKQGSQGIKQMLRTQQFDRAYEIHKSKYVIETMLDDKKTLLFNSLTGELVLLNNEELKVWQSSMDDVLQLFSDSLYFQELFNHWFFVSKDEKLIVDQVRKVIGSLTQSRPIQTFTILTTSACNAKCFYCFESGDPKIKMSMETAEQVVHFIRKYYIDKKILIRWFGGEPLLNTQVIDYISDELRNNNIKYCSRMVTNGYLITSLKNGCFERWNLEQVMITLDNVFQKYDKIKQFSSDVSAFEMVTEGIERLLKEGVFVEIRLNIDLHNLQDIPEIISYIITRYNRYKNYRIVPQLLHENGEKASENTKKSRDLLYNEYCKIIQLINEIDPEHNEPELPSFKAHACVADSTDNIVINPLGELAKCDAQVFSGVVGNINQESFYMDEWIKKRDEVKECHDCPLYPVCYILNRCEAYPLCDELEIMLKTNICRQSAIHIYKKFLQTNNKNP